MPGAEIMAKTSIRGEIDVSYIMNGHSLRFGPVLTDVLSVAMFLCFYLFLSSY